LHKYIYGNANPEANSDPSGYFIGMLFGAAGEGAEVGEGASLMGFGEAAMQSLKPAVAMFNGVVGGYINASLAPSGTDTAGAFMVGFGASLLQSTLNLAGAPCWLAGGVGRLLRSR